MTLLGTMVRYKIKLLRDHLVTQNTCLKLFFPFEMNGHAASSFQTVFFFFTLKSHYHIALYENLQSLHI